MTEIGEIRSVPLHGIIGAIMKAMIQAEVQAAKATVEFIEDVGFSVQPTLKDEKLPPTRPSPKGADLGTLRMVRLRYKKLDENRKMSEFEVSVPTLSLLPIPTIQLKNAKVGLSMKVTGVSTVEGSTIADAKEAKRWIEPQIELRGVLGTRKDPTTNSDRPQHIDIDLELEKGEITAGLSKFLGILDQAIHEEKYQEKYPSAR